MTEEKLRAIQDIAAAIPGYDPALYDLGTRAPYLRGFEAMRAIALHAVQRMAAREPAADAGED